MRLDDSDDAALGGLARGTQHSADFDRMMAVIVDDHGLAIAHRDFARLGEAPPHAAEAGEAVADHFVRTFHLDRHCNRGERVLNVVAPRHGQAHAFDPAIFLPAATHDHVEAIPARIGPDVDAADIRLEIEAVRHDIAIAHQTAHRLNFGMIDAQDRRAIEGDIVDELHEGGLHPVEIAIMVEMFGIDIGDDRDRPVEAQEAAIALVGLHHHPVAIAHSRVRSVLFDDAAVDDGGIDIAAIEQCGDHAGGRCLAMRPRHRDSGFQPHQFGQHFRTAHHGDAVFERVGDFGIGALHRRGGDDDRRAHHVFRRMADRDPDPA